MPLYGVLGNGHRKAANSAWYEYISFIFLFFLFPIYFFLPKEARKVLSLKKKKKKVITEIHIIS